MFPQSNVIDDPIRKYQSELNEMADKAEQLRPVLKACEDAIARTDRKAVPVLRTTRDRPHITLAMFAQDLKEATDLIKELAKEGIRSREKKHEDHNLFDAISMREYKLGEDVTLSVMLSGSQCKMEKVGTKEVPVYEMKCEQVLESQT